ncbi:family 1 glycosylhydrolase, partial [Klebsiella pneumoniae]|nr:family 1 glycosylhydrolase [Klebsiella pneumoniae]
MQQYQFPQGFLWGAAASGPQTEGVTNKRHRSIWDSWFAEQPERFYQQVGPQTVCDTYHLLWSSFFGHADQMVGLCTGGQLGGRAGQRFV